MINIFGIKSVLWRWEVNMGYLHETGTKWKMWPINVQRKALPAGVSHSSDFRCWRADWYLHTCSVKLDVKLHWRTLPCSLVTELPVLTTAPLGARGSDSLSHCAASWRRLEVLQPAGGHSSWGPPGGGGCIYLWIIIIIIIIIIITIIIIIIIIWYLSKHKVPGPHLE